MTEIYNPKGCQTLADIKELPQIRLGIQGPPGEGKTYAAVTFPNPVVINLNRGLGAHIGKSNIIDVPFYNPQFVDSIVPRKPNNPPNKRDAIRVWIEKEGIQLTKNQTLVVDSLSDLERAFDMQQSLEPIITNRGQVDTLAFWRLKIDYFAEIIDMLMSLNCHVVMCAHEQLDRNSSGELNGKLKPLLSGQSADKINKDFTDWFRQRAGSKPKDKVKPETLKSFGMTEPEWNAWINTFPRDTVYYWQTESDDIFSAKAGSLVNFPKFIPATYDSFAKFRRKIS